MFDWDNTDSERIKYIANGWCTCPGTGIRYRIAYASARRAMSIASWRRMFPNSHVEGIVDLGRDPEFQVDRDQLTEPAPVCPTDQGVKHASKKRSPSVRDERLESYVGITLDMLRGGSIAPADLFPVGDFSSDETSEALSSLDDDDLRALIRRAFPPAGSMPPPAAHKKKQLRAAKLGVRKTDPRDITDAKRRLSFM